MPRQQVSDAQWRGVQPYLMSRAGDKGRKPKNLRRTFEGILWIFRTGAPWRDLPGYFGKWNSVYKAFNPQARPRRTAQLAWERQLLAICQPFLADPLAVQAKLCRRIERHIKELFVFVAEPGVPSDNNPAERSLRHLVISRKVSGGTRSERGTESKMTLASIFGTWRARGLNPLAACRQLLTSPQV